MTDTNDDNSTLDELLQSLLDTDEAKLDEDGCLSHELPWGLVSHFRWNSNDRCLLVTIPVGQLNQDDLAARCLILLTFNHYAVSVAGGALGIDPQTNEVYLSRSFVVSATESQIGPSLGGLAGFLTASQAAAQIVSAVNATEFDNERGEVTVAGASLEELSQISAENDETEEEPQDLGDETIELFEEYLRLTAESLQQMGLSGAEPDEVNAYYLTDNDGLEAQIRFDPDFEEIVLTAMIDELEPELLLENAHQLLTQNLFVQGTDGCVIGTSEEEGFVTLTFNVPVEAVTPDATSLKNIISSFWNNARKWKSQLQSMSEVNSPESSVPMDRFV